MDLPINELTDTEADGIEGMLYFAELTQELYNDSIETNDIEELGSMLGIVFKVMTDEDDGIEGMLYFAELTQELYNDSIETNDIEELGSMLGIVFKVMTDEETSNTDPNYFYIEEQTDIPEISNIILTYETMIKSDVENNLRSLMKAPLDVLLIDDVFEMNIDTDDENLGESLNIFHVNEDLGTDLLMQMSDTLVHNLPDKTKNQQEHVKTLHRQLWKLKSNKLKVFSKFLKLRKVMRKLRKQLAQERNKNVKIENKLTEAENNAATSLETLTLARERETTLSICVTQKIDELEQSTEAMAVVLEQFHEFQANYNRIIGLNMKELDDVKRECELYRSNSERMEREASQLKQKLIEVEGKANRATDKWKQKLFEAERRERSVKESLQVMTQKEEQMSLLAAKTQREADQSNELVDSLITQLEAATQNKMASLDLVESELECSICSELFVCPTTLNCSHTFCKHCLNGWKNSGTVNKCPICRNSIISEQKCLVLECYINKLVQNFPEDAKKKRQEMIEQREHS